MNKKCLYCDSKLINTNYTEKSSATYVYKCVNHKDIEVLYYYTIWGDEESFISISFKKLNCSLYIYNPKTEYRKCMFVSSDIKNTFWTYYTDFTPENFEDKIKLIILLT